MSAQPKREQPESAGKVSPKPEMPAHNPPRPEVSDRGKPGTMPENPANVDHEREPAGLAPGTDRTKENQDKRGKS